MRLLIGTFNMGRPPDEAPILTVDRVQTAPWGGGGGVSVFTVRTPPASRRTTGRTEKPPAVGPLTGAYRGPSSDRDGESPEWPPAARGSSIAGIRCACGERAIIVSICGVSVIGARDRSRDSDGGDDGVPAWLVPPISFKKSSNWRG